MQEENQKTLAERESDYLFELDVVAAHLRHLGDAFVMTGNEKVADDLHHASMEITRIKEELNKISFEKLDGAWKEQQKNLGETLKAFSEKKNE